MAGSGTLRSRVTIVDRSGSISATGGLTEGTPTVIAANVPAEIIHASGVWGQQGHESVEAGGLRAVVTHMVRIRYRAGITARMRIVFGTRSFEIINVVNPGERNIELQMYCNELGG